jgi:hypothetical protein
MANALKQITTRAKQLYKKGGTWKAAIKKAGIEYRKKKKKPHAKKKRMAVSGVHHKRRRRARVGSVSKSHYDRVDRKKVDITIGSVSHHKAQAKKAIQQEIMHKAGRRELAIKVNERRKLNRAIAKLKKDYRALC